MGFFRNACLALSLALTACQAPAYPVQPNRSDTLANSVFLIDTGMGTGTAWILKNEDGKSYLITAGHVCENQDEFTLRVRGVREDEIPAHKLMSGDYPDLCEVYTDAVVGEPLALAAVPPVYDEELILIGAPAGIWGGGIAPIFHVRFIGSDKYAGPVFPGDSGGPVISKDGVVGVLVAGWFSPQIGEFVTVKVLKDWLTPETPGD